MGDGEIRGCMLMACSSDRKWLHQDVTWTLDDMQTSDIQDVIRSKKIVLKQLRIWDVYGLVIQ